MHEVITNNYSFKHINLIDNLMMNHQLLQYEIDKIYFKMINN